MRARRWRCAASYVSAGQGAICPGQSVAVVAGEVDAEFGGCGDGLVLMVGAWPVGAAAVGVPQQTISDWSRSPNNRNRSNGDLARLELANAVGTFVSASLLALAPVLRSDGGLPLGALACCHLVASFALNSARVDA